MKRLTKDELKDLRDKEDWNALWTAAIPWVKLAATSLRTPDREEMFQEGLLVIGKKVRSWDPAKGAFASHIYNQARFAMLKYLRKTSRIPGVEVSLNSEQNDDDVAEATRHEATYQDAGSAPEGYDDIALQIARQCAPEAVERLLGHLPAETAVALRELSGLATLDSQDDPQQMRSLYRSRGASKGGFYRVIQGAFEKLGKVQRQGESTGTPSLYPPPGRQSWRTHQSADRRYPGFWHGLASAMGDTDAWRESVGSVWNDWSWKPTEADIARGCKR